MKSVLYKKLLFNQSKNSFKEFLDKREIEELSVEMGQMTYESNKRPREDNYNSEIEEGISALKSIKEKDDNPYELSGLYNYVKMYKHTDIVNFLNDNPQFLDISDKIFNIGLKLGSEETK